MGFGHPERQLVVAVNVLGVEAVEVDEIGPEVVDDGAKAEAVPPRGRHVDDVDLAVGDMLAPVLQIFCALEGHRRALVRKEKAASSKRAKRSVFLRNGLPSHFILLSE